MITWACLTALAAGQSPENAGQVVRDALRVTSSGYYTGSTEKSLERLGDNAAIELIRIFEGRDLSPAEIRSALLIVDLSFAAPRVIAAESDRKPRATLLLLRYLDYQAREPELKDKILQTKRSLEEVQR